MQTACCERKMTDLISSRHMDNYQIWKFQVKAFLIVHDIDDGVDGARVKPGEIDIELATWKKDDAKAMYFISSTVEPAHIESVLTSRSSHEMWTKLAYFESANHGRTAERRRRGSF